MRRTPRTSAARLNIALMTVFSCLSWLPLGAETVLHRFSSSSPDPRFERLLYLAAGSELLSMGVSSRAEDDGKADYLLTAAYALAGGEASLEYSLSAGDSPKETKTRLKASLKIDSSFDAKAAELVRELVKRAGIVFLPDPEASIDGILALPAPPAETAQADTAQAESAAPETMIDAQVAEGETSVPPEEGLPAEPPPDTPAGEEGAEPTAEAAPPPDPEIPGEARAMKPNLELSASIVGIAFLGELNRFIHYGAGGEAYGGASWSFGAWSVSAGLEAGWARAFNDPGVAGGPLSLSTARLASRLGWTGKGSEAFLSVSAGAAILSLFSPEGARSKAVPCAGAGIAALLPLAGDFSLGLGLGFQAIFDDAFIPSIVSSIIARWES